MLDARSPDLHYPFCLFLPVTYATIHNFNTISTSWYKECLVERINRVIAPVHHKFDCSAPKISYSLPPPQPPILYTSFSSILNLSHFSMFYYFSLCARRGDNQRTPLITDTTTTFTYLVFSPCILRQPPAHRGGHHLAISVCHLLSIFMCPRVIQDLENPISYGPFHVH